jgi:hypothetical protein
MLTACMLICAGTLLLAFAVVLARREKRAVWIKVPGTIKHSEVRFDGEQYQPFIRYEYAIQSQTYEGCAVRSLMINYNWSGPAGRVCERYPVGASVSVYVDPMQPNTAVLEYGSHGWGKALVCIVSAIFIICGLLLLGK